MFFSGIKDFKRPTEQKNHVQSEVLRVHNHKFSIDVLGSRILQPGTTVEMSSNAKVMKNKEEKYRRNVEIHSGKMIFM